MATKVKETTTVLESTDPFAEMAGQMRAEMRAEIRREIERRIQMELAQTERALAELQREIQVLLDDTNADLARLMRKNAQRSQLEAYYKGLTFQLSALDAKRTGGDSSH
jgi:hypothetical protein